MNQRRLGVPIEQRNLLSEKADSFLGGVSVGRLEMWIEIIPFKELSHASRAPVLIEPPNRYQMELRAIV